MGALPAAVVEFGDGDGGDDDGPQYSWAGIALALARVLHQVRARGPYFAAAIDAEIANLQKENHHVQA